jgi:hypothetical protein
MDHTTHQPLPVHAQTDITDEDRAFYRLCERTRDHAWEVLRLLLATHHSVAKAEWHNLRLRTRNGRHYGDDLRAAADRALRQLTPGDASDPLAENLRAMIALSWEVRRQRRAEPTWASLWAEIERINAGEHIIRCATHLLFEDDVIVSRKRSA